MKIKIRKRIHAGKALYSPACEISKEILKLCRKAKVFTQKDIDILKKLGFELEILPYIWD